MAKALKGNAWDVAGRIWYDTMVQLTTTSQFVDCARISCQVAGDAEVRRGREEGGQGGVEEGRHPGVTGSPSAGSGVKVTFAQSGGFAGLIRQCTLDTATMTPDEGRRLEQLVRQSGLSTAVEELSRGHRDLEQYEIQIDDGRRSISVVYDSATLPQSVKQLVGYLKKCARPAGAR